MTAGAEREFKNLPAKDRQRTWLRINALALNPRPPGCSKLSSIEGFRIRAGNYRVLYVIDDEARTVTVYEIGHRREIYR